MTIIAEKNFQEGIYAVRVSWTNKDGSISVDHSTIEAKDFREIKDYINLFKNSSEKLNCKFDIRLVRV